MNSLLQQRALPAEQIRNFLKDKQAWENAVGTYTGPDPLEHWYNYICWYDLNNHGDPENKFRETLEKCLTLFEHSEYYKQDVRMVKLWVKYIDLQPNPLNLYQILYQRGIGKHCSCFYIGWAHYYDSANALKEAESVYNLGFQAKAEPFAELQQAHTKFRLSVSQRMLYNDNSSKKQSANHLNEQRQQITNLAGTVKKMNNESQELNQNNGYTNVKQAQTEAVSNYQFTDLENSGTVISSSLNYIYNESQTGTYIDESTSASTKNDECTLQNVKLPAQFAIYSRNNYEVWKPALFLEEPDDPNKKCFYQKDKVYPGDGNEYSPEEIRVSKWISHLEELKERQLQEQKQIQLQLEQQQQQQQEQQQQQLRQQQQYSEATNVEENCQYHQKNNDTGANNNEDQIEASTICFSTNSAEGTPKNKTIKIKFKKEKPNDSLNGCNSHYSIAHNEITAQNYNYEASAPVSNNGFHPYNYHTSTPKSKKSKKLKIINNYADPTKFVPSANSNSNSSDCGFSQNSYTAQSATVQPQTQFDDANLLLSFARVTGTPSNSSGYRTDQRRTNDITPIATMHKNDSFNYNDNANFSFNESNYLDNSNCSVASGVGRLNFRDTQRDDFSTYAENSFFATENDKELKQKRLDKALSVIDTHLAKLSIDPFNNELCKAFLTKVDFPSYETDDNTYKIVSTPLPKLSNTKTISISDIRYNIEKEVGRGSYGSVYKALDTNTGTIVALKYQKPPNIWELYVCNEVRKRICISAVLPGLMDISSALIAPNASILVTEFSPHGSLLDINNKMRQATKKVMHESLVMHFGSQILNIVHHLHGCKIIHADIKPDNFLLMRVPNTDLHYPSLRLIDFGCAIDMSLFPDDTQFQKVIQTDGFTCVEMQENRPWSYQTDLFCVAGTVHVMLFGEYMQIQKKFTSWDIKQKLPRYLKKHVWNEFFSQLLNIKNSYSLPDLMKMKMLFDEEAAKMDSELQTQIRTLSNLLHRR